MDHTLVVEHAGEGTGEEFERLLVSVAQKVREGGGSQFEEVGSDDLEGARRLGLWWWVERKLEDRPGQRLAAVSVEQEESESGGGNP